MKKTKEEQTLPIAELLPEGLSEAAINDVAELVNNVICEQVEEKTLQLEAKVKGFLRARVDELKDQAVRELHEEDETIRNASLFESVKTLMALELKKDDEDNVISDLVQEQREVEGEVDILMEELRKSFEETEKLETSLKALGKKVGKLEGDRAKLLEAVSVLEESKEKPFKSSEKAVIISEDVDNKKITKSNPRAFNDFLTPEVMKFMPSDKS
tara:strand:- start:1177 stop:1818 length:642 start_codon:yes stop_codon:yes gene_type:complete